MDCLISRAGLTFQTICPISRVAETFNELLSFPTTQTVAQTVSRRQSMYPDKEYPCNSSAAAPL